MSMVTEHAGSPSANPLETVADFAATHDWLAERSAEDELAIALGGKWCDFHVWVSWRAEIRALQFACVYDMKAPRGNHAGLHGLLILANESLSLGHFDLWREEGMILFRHVLLLGRDCVAPPEQIELLFDVALSECERFFPAIQYVLWGGKSPEEAAAAALMDCAGEA